MAPDAEFTDSLADLLFRFDTGDLSTAGVTAALTRAIVAWAHERGWKVRTEARVEVPLAAGPTRQLGFVDVLISRGGDCPNVAIEIDSADKPWSVVKLQHAAFAGMHAVWIRWGDDAWAGMYDEVDVIQLRHMRRVGRRQATEQLTVWG